MSHTIAIPITTWAELRGSDRGVLNRAEVAALLTLDTRTVDRAIEDGTIPAVHVGRRVLIPRPAPPRLEPARRYLDATPVTAVPTEVPASALTVTPVLASVR